MPLTTFIVSAGVEASNAKELLGIIVTIPCCDSNAHHGMNLSRRCIGEIFWSAIKTIYATSSSSNGYMGLKCSEHKSTQYSTMILTRSFGVLAKESYESPVSFTSYLPKISTVLRYLHDIEAQFLPLGKPSECVGSILRRRPAIHTLPSNLIIRVITSELQPLLQLSSNMMASRYLGAHFAQAPLRQLRSTLIRSSIQSRFASTEPSKLVGPMDNAFNRERLAVKQHAAQSAGKACRRALNLFLSLGSPCTF